MNRSIRHRRWAVGLTAFGGALLLVSAVQELATAQDKDAGPPPAPVRVAQVVERSVAPSRTFVGTVRPVRQSTLSSEVDGLVEELLAHEGERVAAGAPVARLRTARLEIDLDAARAVLDLRTQELAELENGSRVEEIAQAEAALGSREAARDFALWRKQAAQDLSDQGTISEDEYREAVLEHRAAELAVRAADAALELLRAGPRAERIAQARARLEEQKAMVRRLEDDLDRHTIAAPFDGYVIHEGTEVGQWVSSGDAVATVAELDRVDVRIGLLEDYAVGLRTGAAASVSIAALEGRSFDGEVVVIVPQADPRARTFPVDVRLENETTETGDLLLKSGLFARVSIPVGAAKPRLMVPKDALVLGGRAPTIYVVTLDGADSTTGAARPVQVTVGIATGDEIEITGEVGAGDIVVVQGNERLRPGQRVSVSSGDEQ